MKKLELLPVLALLLFYGLAAREAKAQTAYGVSTVGYDAITNLVSGYSATELDYLSTWYYDPYVEAYLYRNNTVVDSDAHQGYGMAMTITNATGIMGSQYTNLSDHYVVAYYAPFHNAYYDGYGYDFLPGAATAQAITFMGSDRPSMCTRNTSI